MPRRFNFTEAQFRHLFAKILVRYQSSPDLKPVQENVSRFFGFNTYDPYPKKEKDGSLSQEPYTEKTLKTMMLRDAPVEQYLTANHYARGKEAGIKAVRSDNDFNGKNLYNKYKTIYEDGRDSCAIEEPYASAYLLYAGYKNFEAFLKEFELDSMKKNAPKKSTKIAYKGFVYSYRFHKIHEYALEIEYAEDGGIIGVSEQGFHDNLSQPLYKGHAYMLNSKMHLILDKKEGDQEELKDRMKIILDSGEKPTVNPVMRGLILAISSYQGEYPLSTETVVVSKDYDLSPERELKIRRYLFLHRYNIRIKTKAMNLDALEAKKVNVDILSHMVGHFRTWRFDENFDIVQSMLHIREDYETYCYSNQYSDKNYNEQVCLININKDDVPFPNKTICISTHPNIGVGVIAYAMIKPLPVVVRKEKLIADRITGGVISFVGREENGFPFSSSIVLLKEEDPARINDPKQWKTIEKHRITDEIAGREDLQELYKKLKDLEQWKYAQWKALP